MSFDFDDNEEKKDNNDNNNNEDEAEDLVLTDDNDDDNTGGFGHDHSRDYSDDSGTSDDDDNEKEDDEDRPPPQDHQNNQQRQLQNPTRDNIPSFAQIHSTVGNLHSRRDRSVKLNDEQLTTLVLLHILLTLLEQYYDDNSRFSMRRDLLVQKVNEHLHNHNSRRNKVNRNIGPAKISAIMNSLEADFSIGRVADFATAESTLGRGNCRYYGYAVKANQMPLNSAPDQVSALKSLLSGQYTALKADHRSGGALGEYTINPWRGALLEIDIDKPVVSLKTLSSRTLALLKLIPKKVRSVQCSKSHVQKFYSALQLAVDPTYISPHSIIKFEEQTGSSLQPEELEKRRQQLQARLPTLETAKQHVYQFLSRNSNLFPEYAVIKAMQSTFPSPGIAETMIEDLLDKKLLVRIIARGTTDRPRLGIPGVYKMPAENDTPIHASNKATHFSLSLYRILGVDSVLSKEDLDACLVGLGFITPTSFQRMMHHCLQRCIVFEVEDPIYQGKMMFCTTFEAWSNYYKKVCPSADDETISSSLNRAARRASYNTNSINVTKTAPRGSADNGVNNNNNLITPSRRQQQELILQNILTVIPQSLHSAVQRLGPNLLRLYHNLLCLIPQNGKSSDLVIRALRTDYGWNDNHLENKMVSILVKNYQLVRYIQHPTERFMALEEVGQMKLHLLNQRLGDYIRNDNNTNNDSSNVDFDNQQEEHVFPATSSSHLAPLLEAPTTASTSTYSSAPQQQLLSSLKTATKLYFENIKDLVPSEGLEKSSVMVLMGHQHGWKDQNMQQEFLDELSSKGLVQLRSDPSNPSLVKIFIINQPSLNGNTAPVVSYRNHQQQNDFASDNTFNNNNSNVNNLPPPPYHQTAYAPGARDNYQQQDQEGRLVASSQSYPRTHQEEQQQQQQQQQQHNSSAFSDAFEQQQPPARPSTEAHAAVAAHQASASSSSPLSLKERIRETINSSRMIAELTSKEKIFLHEVLSLMIPSEDKISSFRSPNGGTFNIRRDRLFSELQAKYSTLISREDRDGICDHLVRRGFIRVTPPRTASSIPSVSFEQNFRSSMDLSLLLVAARSNRNNASGGTTTAVRRGRSPNDDRNLQVAPLQPLSSTSEAATAMAKPPGKPIRKEDVESCSYFEDHYRDMIRSSGSYYEKLNRTEAKFLVHMCRFASIGMRENQSIKRVSVLRQELVKWLVTDQHLFGKPIDVMEIIDFLNRHKFLFLDKDSNQSTVIRFHSDFRRSIDEKLAVVPEDPLRVTSASNNHQSTNNSSNNNNTVDPPRNSNPQVSSTTENTFLDAEISDDIFFQSTTTDDTQQQQQQQPPTIAPPPHTAAPAAPHHSQQRRDRSETETHDFYDQYQQQEQPQNQVQQQQQQSSIANDDDQNNGVQVLYDAQGRVVIIDAQGRVVKQRQQEASNSSSPKIINQNNSSNTSSPQNPTQTTQRSVVIPTPLGRSPCLIPPPVVFRQGKIVWRPIDGARLLTVPPPIRFRM